MSLKFYNTLSRRLQEFTPLEAGKVRMYTCGPTVYDYAHIGNYRTFMFEDLLRRYLEYRGYEVRQVMNLTDVDDNTIRRSREHDLPLAEHTAIFKKAFQEDLATLNIQPASAYPEATSYIPQMIEMVQDLERKGYAYPTEDGSVYFKITEFREYGHLAHLSQEDMRVGQRVADDNYEKEGVRDFALWKGWKKEDGDVRWDSPWGPGRPGWHIECSVMSTQLLGNHFDIHCGGVDNIFPHHENEIAQSRCATGEAFVNYWLHSEYLLVDNRKMSKSLNNFHTLRDILEQGFSPAAVRWMLLTTHYRQKLNFSLDRLGEAAHAVERLQVFQDRLREYAGTGAEDTVALAAEVQNGFQEAMDADLNISGGLAAVFELVRRGNRLMDAGSLSRDGAATLLELLERIDHVLGVLDLREPSGAGEDAESIEKWIAARKAARAAKDFARADRIRDELLAQGIELLDTPAGTKWKRRR